MWTATGDHVREETRSAVDVWWRDVFDIEEGLWSSMSVVHPHARLADYEGWYVAWRGTGVHVSTSSASAACEVTSLAGRPAVALQAERLGFEPYATRLAVRRDL